VIWREKRALLIILALLFAANTVFFFTYRVRYQERLDSMEERMDTAKNQLAAAKAARLRAEQRLASYRRIENDVARVYDEYWSTQNERLTAMIAEVKRLAVASGIVPSSITFDQAAIGAKQISAAAPSAGATAGRRHRPIGATEVGISFTVDGSYDQVRRLINLLELSSQFIIVDRLALSARDGQTLTLNLHVKTLFRDPDAPTAGATKPL
jgi:hypothetical protein